MPRARLFVSAVTKELAGARGRAAAVLNGLGYDTVSEEDFPTGHGELRRWLAEQIDGCEGVIQLVGSAYGAEPPPSAGPLDPWPDPALGRCSYTQFELLYAWGRATRKPKPAPKPTWVILAGPDFPRDRPVDRLDLPPPEAGADVDALVYQAERRALQQGYLERLTAENHLRLSAATETELENLLLRLRDELAALRVADSRRQRRLGWGIAAILAGVLALGGGGWWAYRDLFETTSAAAQVTPSRIRAQLLEAIETTYAHELAAAEQAADWQERERLRQAAEAQRVAQAGRVDEFAETFRQIAEGTKASTVFTELTRILQQQGVGEALAYMETQRPGILQRVRARRAAAEARDQAELEPLLTSARLYATEGQAESARQLYDEVLALAPNWPDALDAHRLFLVEQGDLAVIRGDLSAAGRDFRSALERARQLVQVEPDVDRWQRNLAPCLERLGDHARALGDLRGALIRYEQCLAIAQRLADADPSNAGWQRDLSVSLEKLGDLKSARGDLDGALADYEQSLAIAQRLADADPSNAGWQRDLSVSLNKLGDLKSARGDLDGALADYEQSLAIHQRLADADPSNAGWQRDLTVSLDKLGDLKSARGDLDGALADYEQSLAIRQRLADADPSNAGWQRDLVISHVKLAEVSSADGAAAHLQVALSVLEAMSAADILAPTDAWLPDEVRRRLREIAPSQSPAPSSP